jgi:hypothetical protein
MSMRKLLARMVGTLYVLVGAANLYGLLLPAVHEEVISLGAVILRYSGFVVVGVGLLMLQKWAAYVWALLLAVNTILIFAVYGGQTQQLSGLLSLLPWIGPIIIVVFFYYIWPVLKPQRSKGASHGSIPSDVVETEAQ